MRNRADNPYTKAAAPVMPRVDPSLDGRPGARLLVLYAGLAVALIGIALRLTIVQTGLSADYADEFGRLTVHSEPVPSHDGRIIAADGEILAEDRQVFSLNVHYRWLENPPDPAWLKSQALSRLDRPSRRDPARVSAARTEVLKTRNQLWRELSRVTGLSPRVLALRRKDIQRRVTTIYQNVEKRRAAQGELPADNSAAVPEAGLWHEIWGSIVQALTTPPVREATEPLVIQEQLDYHPLVADLPIETAVEVEAHPERFPGTRIVVDTRRVYPHGHVAPHLVGYRTPLDDESLKERKLRFQQGDPLDYRPGDRLGRTGLEKYYERQLRGLRGERKLELNRRGEIVRSEVVREPRYGQDLVLSLNLSLQQAAEGLLDDCLDHIQTDEVNGQPLPTPPGGSIVAIDIRTGAVLAAASAPRFDLNLFVDHDQGAWEEVLSDPRKPLFHRAAEMAVAPGSVFKVLSALAFLESGQLDPERPFHCQGYLDDPDRYRCLIFRQFGVSHGDITLVDALARSCNVYFFSAARRIGGGAISEWGIRLGFGQPTGLDLPGERGGHLPLLAPPGGNQRRTPPASGDALQLAIGQARLTTTPLQIARLMALVANGGKLVTPHLVDATGPARVLSTDSDSPATNLEPVPIAGLSPRTLHALRRGLSAVVADPHGTGYKTVRLPDVTIAGKTGTAEAGGGKPDHAWFAGYAPAERPRVAFVVVLENAGSGGHAAGPVARKFVQACQSRGLLSGGRVTAPAAN